MTKKVNSSKRVVVIGAGIGGLATAARLQRHGYQVEIYEKEALVGGRAHLIIKDGYRFDTGPTILMMPDILKQLFTDCDRQLDDYLELIQLEPNYQANFADGEKLMVSSNMARFGKELARLNERAPEQMYRFFSDSAKLYRLSIDNFIDKNFDKLTDFIDVSAMIKLLRARGLKKLYNYVSANFDDPRLRMLFSFQSMYIGVSPYEAPAVYSIVSYMETGLGIWYPKGGMHCLPSAIAKLTTDLGGKIHTSSPVKRIVTKRGKTLGIELEDGTIVKADIVVSNADLPYTYKYLLNRDERPRFSDKKLTKLKHASSALLFYWGVDLSLDSFYHHNIYFSADFRENLDQIFHQGKLPTEPAFYVYVPTKTDPSLAPKGKHIMYVLVPVPNLSAGLDWKDSTRRMKAKVIAAIKAQHGLDISNHIETETVFTPEDFKKRFNLTLGSAFGLSHHFFQSGYFRPHNASVDVKGLYLVGASTYPGSGVPMVLLSGKLVVERIIKDQKGL